MKYKTLNKTDLSVSTICLGTMTFGMQNTVEDAFEQLNVATSRGINFIDTAELYSIPALDIETFGRTEKFIGKWLHSKQNRADVIISTKVLGPTNHGILSVSRPNPKPLTPNTINTAVEKSLKRLRTDYIDLYQIHWPLRATNCFGLLGYKHSPKNYIENSELDVESQILQTIETMNALIKQGKIRHYGLSNETVWGAMTFNRLADKHKLAPPITVQNPYNLLNRSYEVGLAEVSLRENMGLLAYSPLADGMLSGKHINGIVPNTRVALYPEYFGRYSNSQSNLATIEYNNIANDLGISLTAMSLAFVNHQPFLTSTIVGATTIEQLNQCIDSISLELDSEIIKKIEKTHTVYTYPAP